MENKTRSRRRRRRRRGSLFSKILVCSNGFCFIFFRYYYTKLYIYITSIVAMRMSDERRGIDFIREHLFIIIAVDI